ncbi:MAG: 4Fe-4S double cluster binding domain-containing protein, partial [Thermodesulfobacteriota bacterium]|nr:4Fe-4S double cluster binding domain-containing protein [Thermodesulfobacteriota bacterium]
EFIPVKALKNQCGPCTLCVDSCPTGALEKPFYLDASKCLSYLTIEHKEAVDADLGIKMGNCFFGCDRCQEVCLFNKENTSIQVLLPTMHELINMTDEDFKMRFGKTALARAGLEKLKSNIRVIRNC